MEELADNIATIFHDYHNYNNFQFSSSHVMRWVTQFPENDRCFVLEELLHLLGKGIYISEQKGREILYNQVEALGKHYKFRDTFSFLKNVDFLQLQPLHKSQSVLLKLLNEELHNKLGLEIKHCGSNTKQFAIYIDDLLATGGTIFKDIETWLRTNNTDGETNMQSIVSGKKKLAVSLFCKHNWANVDWRLKCALNEDGILNKIKYQCYYMIENHPMNPKSKLNFAYPISSQPPVVQEYLTALPADYKAEHAFRKENTPIVEDFFSSPTNRMRLENVFLLKGIELLQNASQLKPNHRPLGMTPPSYKTLGSGTLFFTWRNISNTTPIVFWWKSADWYPLFPLFHRGL